MHIYMYMYNTENYLTLNNKLYNDTRLTVRSSNHYSLSLYLVFFFSSNAFYRIANISAYTIEFEPILTDEAYPGRNV